MSTPLFPALVMNSPDAVDAGQGQWRAIVCIAAGAGSVQGKRCQFPQDFPSREAALQFAIEQCRLKSADRRPGWTFP